MRRKNAVTYPTPYTQDCGLDVVAYLNGQGIELSAEQKTRLVEICEWYTELFEGTVVVPIPEACHPRTDYPQLRLING